MNVNELVERREAVKEPLRVDKLLSHCIFPVESQVLIHMIASTCMRLFDER